MQFSGAGCGQLFSFPAQAEISDWQMVVKTVRTGMRVWRFSIKRVLGGGK